MSYEQLKQNVTELFKNTTVEDIVGRSRPIVSLAPTESVRDALHKLLENHVRSAPVLKADGAVSFVDFIDFVFYLVDLLGGEDNINFELIKDADFQNRFFNTPIEIVANYSNLDNYSPISLNASVFDASVALSRGNKRLVIEDSNGRITNVVSHTDIIGLMRRHAESARATSLQCTAEELGLSADPSIGGITEDKKCIEAFALMKKNKAGALAILNDEGEIVSVISARDIKLLVTGPFDLLLVPVLDFIGVERQQNPLTVYPYLCCKLDTTIESVLKKLSATRVHRLIMVDNKKRPVGCASVHNLITAIIS